jgi:hypothetical protein
MILLADFPYFCVRIYRICFEASAAMPQNKFGIMYPGSIQIWDPCAWKLSQCRAPEDRPAQCPSQVDFLPIFCRVRRTLRPQILRARGIWSILDHKIRDPISLPRDTSRTIRPCTAIRSGPGVHGAPVTTQETEKQRSSDQKVRRGQFLRAKKFIRRLWEGSEVCRILVCWFRILRVYLYWASVCWNLLTAHHETSRRYLR